MSSGRGPGMVGLMMALIVVGGFGAIYVFVFDKELQGGGKTVEAETRELVEEIETYQAQIKHSEEVRETSKKHAEIAGKLEKATTSAEAVKGKAASLGEQMSKVVSDIESIEKKFSDYRGAYRKQVREDAVGEKFPELKTVSGTVYADVEVREVTEVGIGVRHRDGSKRISYEELTPEWQERFQFDPKEKAEALAREEAARQMYEMAMREQAGEAAPDAAGADDSAPEAPEEPLLSQETEEGKAQLRRLIAAKEIQLAKLRTQWGQLRGAAEKVQGDEELTRSRGKSGMGKVHEMRQRIQNKEREIAKCVRELAALKSKQRP